MGEGGREGGKQAGGRGGHRTESEGGRGRNGTNNCNVDWMRGCIATTAAVAKEGVLRDLTTDLLRLLLLLCSARLLIFWVRPSVAMALTVVPPQASRHLEFLTGVLDMRSCHATFLMLSHQV